jgi:Sec-independent protein translocase protein TatA
MAVAALIGLNGMEDHPATPNTVAVASGSIRLADSDQDNQDQLNEMEEQQSQETAQQTEDTSQEEQQLVDEQNAFDESMTAGNN